MPVTTQDVGPRHYDIGPEGTVATLANKVAWADLETYLLELNCTIHANIGIQIPTGASHPSFNWLKLERITIDPFEPECPESTDQPGVLYPHGARVVRHYRSPKQTEGRHPEDASIQVPVGAFMTHEWSVTAEMMMLNQHGFVWDDGADSPVSPNIDLAISISTITHKVHLHNIEDPPWAWMAQLPNHVNSTEIFGIPAGCLMYPGTEATPYRMEDGTDIWTLHHIFLERHVYGNMGTRITWNQWFREDATAGANLWQTIKHKNTGHNPFLSGEFRLLFMGA